jgi:hypothetical protein
MTKSPEVICTKTKCYYNDHGNGCKRKEIVIMDTSCKSYRIIDQWGNIKVGEYE